jgi:hypothetical protein
MPHISPLVKVNITDPDPNHLEKSDLECSSYTHDPDPELRAHILNFFVYKPISPTQCIGQHALKLADFPLNNCFWPFLKASVCFFIIMTVQCCGVASF